MSASKAAFVPVRPGEDATVAAHLAAIAEMHAAALTHIASLAEPWLQSTPAPRQASPATDRAPGGTRTSTAPGGGIAAT